MSFNALVYYFVIKKKMGLVKFYDNIEQNSDQKT